MDIFNLTGKAKLSVIRTIERYCNTSALAHTMDPFTQLSWRSGVAVVLCLAFGISFVKATEDTTCKGARSVGREFIVGFLQTPQMDSMNELHIAGASRIQATVTVTAPDIFNVPYETDLEGSNQFRIISLQNMPDLSDTAVLVESTSDISVIGVIAGNNSGAFLALPVEALGTEYYVASYNVATRVLRAKRGSEFLIIGTQEEETTVLITFSGLVRHEGTTYDRGSSLTITLGRLKIARFTSKLHDLTGSHIVADRPIVVISGSKCADVPVEVRYCDHLVEQLPPFNFWGSHFVTTPLASRRAGDIFRVVAGRNGTIITICGQQYALNAGEFHEESVPSFISCAISSSQPVLVVQYSKGGASDKTSADPSMIIVPALEQFFPESLFATSDISPNSVRVSSYLNVVIQCDLIPFLTQNMFAVSSGLFEGAQSFNVTVAGRNMCSTQISPESGRHLFQFDNEDGVMSLILYGNADGEIATSFGLPVGFSFRDNSCFNLLEHNSNDPAVKRTPASSSISPIKPPFGSNTYPIPSDPGIAGGANSPQENNEVSPGNMLAVSLIVFMLSFIMVTLLIGYVVLLKKRVNILEEEKQNYYKMAFPIAADGYIGLDGSQIAHREYMTLNNSDQMWHFNRRSDRSVFRGVQPAHSVRSNNSRVSTVSRIGGSTRQSIQSHSERIFEADTLELMSNDLSPSSRHSSNVDTFGNINPSFHETVSHSSQQDIISEIRSQPSSLRKPTRPIRRHHSQVEAYCTTAPVPKPRYHGPRGLRRSVSTPGEDIFGNPLKVYYHVPRNDPVVAYDRPRNRTCSEGLSPSAADILLPPEEVAGRSSRKNSSNESESSLPLHQDDGYMSMKEARISIESNGSQSGDSPSRGSRRNLFPDENHNKREQIDADSTDYTELF